MQEVEQQEDRLSKLPDDILVSVLDRLDVRGAARSSILSRRWRHLPLSISRITLDVKRHKLKDDGSKSALSKKAQTNLSVAEAARSLLARRDQQQAARVLYLRFYLRDESMDIVRAVSDAMARGCSIGKATFVILGEKIDIQCTDEDLAGHAARLLSCLDACPRAFAGLTTLHVESVKLGQSDINNLLGTCCRLKSLSLLNCGSGRDTALAVQYPRIAVLKLVACGTIQLKWLPELVKLTCEHWVPSRNPLLFGHVPRLRTVMLTTSCTSGYKILQLSEVLDNASIRELWMDFDAERLRIQPEPPKQLAPRLNNLRILNLENIPEECGIAWTFFLLEAAPLLEELHIQVQVQQPDFFLSRLKLPPLA
ncbi:hypothetical protein VPH35_038257 [Triticum aestivum]